MWQHQTFWPARPTLAPTNPCFAFETQNIPPTFPSNLQQLMQEQKAYREQLHIDRHMQAQNQPLVVW